MDRTSQGDDAVSWIRHRSGSLVNAAGERKASPSGFRGENCVVVQEVNPRA